MQPGSSIVSLCLSNAGHWHWLQVEHYYSAAFACKPSLRGFYSTVATGPSPPPRGPRRQRPRSETQHVFKEMGTQNQRATYSSPLPPASPPRSARKPGVLISHQASASLEAVSVLLRIYRDPVTNEPSQDV